MTALLWLLIVLAGIVIGHGISILIDQFMAVSSRPRPQATRRRAYR